MGRGRVYILAALFLLLVFPLRADGASRIVPMTRMEVSDILRHWFERSGFRVSSAREGYDTLNILAARNGEEWKVRLRPHSPIACEVDAVYLTRGAERPGEVQRLWNRLSGYEKGSRVEVDPSLSGIPAAVLARNESAVCISAESQEEPLQFSGFVIDASGLILCTAHNLDGIRNVRVTLASGRMLTGRLIRADFERDIALVETSGRLPAALPLPEKSLPLSQGQRIFSVGCPENLGSTVYSGNISGPPGLVGGQYLLQVTMKVYPGSSGSPVFDENGNLVAMVKARFRGMNSRGFLIPGETIIDFIRDATRPGGGKLKGKDMK